MLDRRLAACRVVDCVSVSAALENCPCRSSWHKLPPPQITNWWFHIVRVALGLFLLVVAYQKAHGLVGDPFATDSFLSSPRLLVATIELEIVLGLWLLSGWLPRAVWMTTLAFFGILAAVSLYLALEGQQSCGCFGRVTVSP